MRGLENGRQSRREPEPFRKRPETAANGEPKPTAKSEIENRKSGILSLSHHLHDHPLIPLAIKLRIKDPLPRSKVQLARGDRHDDLVMDQQRLQMRVAIVLAGLVMLVVVAKRCQMLQPVVDVL